MNKGGRPKQFDVTKLVKLTAEQYDAIRAYAEQHGLTDSEAIRRLIELGLEGAKAPRLASAVPAEEGVFEAAKRARRG